MKVWVSLAVVIGFVASFATAFIVAGNPFTPEVNEPKRIPTYTEVVPQGFSAPASQRVIDIRDTTKMMNPRLGIVRITDNIVAVACPDKVDICVVTSLYEWVRTHITHVDAMPAREYLLGPEETILFREGTDVMLSVLLASMLRAEGLDSRIAHTPYYTWTQVQLDNRWVDLDSGCGDCYLSETRYTGEQSRIQFIS